VKPDISARKRVVVKPDFSARKRVVKLHFTTLRPAYGALTAGPGGQDVPR